MGNTNSSKLAKTFTINAFQNELGLTMNQSKDKHYIINRNTGVEYSNLNESYIQIQDRKHYGIPICSIPLGSREYVETKFRTTVQETTNIINSLTDRISNIDAHAALISR